jgi:hypothetical protein
MSWTTLKAAIDAIITTNGNNEITGAATNGVFDSVIDNVGENATYVGIAAPDTVPGTPDGPVFYLTSEAGTYANFSGLVVAEGEVVILSWDSAAWSKETIVDLKKINGNYPYEEEAAPVGSGTTLTTKQIREFVIDMYLDGTPDPAMTYSTASIGRGVGGEWYVAVHKQDGSPGVVTKVAQFITGIDPEIGDAITIHKLSEFGGSGISGEIAVNWSKIVAATNYTAMYSYLGYELNLKIFDRLNSLYINPRLRDMFNSMVPVGRDSTGSYTGVPSADIWYSELVTTFDNNIRIPKSISYEAFTTNQIKFAVYSNVLGTPVKKLESSAISPGSTGVKEIPIATVFPTIGSLPSGVDYWILAGMTGAVQPCIKFKTGTTDGSFSIDDADDSFRGLASFFFSYWLNIELYSINDDQIETLEEKVSKLDGSQTSFDLKEELSKNDNVFVPFGTHNITSTVVVPSGKRIYGVRGKSILQAASGVLKVLSISGGEDITIEGVTIKGEGSDIDYLTDTTITSIAEGIAEVGAGTKYGVYIDGGKRITIKDTRITNFDYCGIYGVNGSGTTYHDGHNFSNLFIQNCYTGIFIDDRFEFGKYSNIEITDNVIGLRINSANMNMVSSNINRNVFGCLIEATSTNWGHGGFANVFINHNEMIGLYLNAVTSGFTFNGLSCQIDLLENIYVKSSTGIIFCGCNIKNGFTVEGGSVGITGTMFRVNTSVITEVSTPYLKLTGNFYEDGSDPSAINN